MGRPRKWEKKVEDDDEVREAPSPNGLAALGRRTPKITLEQYVAHELEMTQKVLDAGASNPIVDGKDRIDRARAYAEWRYERYCRREINSL